LGGEGASSKGRGGGLRGERKAAVKGERSLDTWSCPSEVKGENGEGPLPKKGCFAREKERAKIRRAAVYQRTGGKENPL